MIATRPLPTKQHSSEFAAQNVAAIQSRLILIPQKQLWNFLIAFFTHSSASKLTNFTFNRKTTHW
jgi:hypothetical protein